MFEAEEDSEEKVPLWKEVTPQMRKEKQVKRLKWLKSKDEVEKVEVKVKRDKKNRKKKKKNKVKGTEEEGAVTLEVTEKEEVRVKREKKNKKKKKRDKKRGKEEGTVMLEVKEEDLPNAKDLELNAASIIKAIAQEDGVALEEKTKNKEKVAEEGGTDKTKAIKQEDMEVSEGREDELHVQEKGAKGNNVAEEEQVDEVAVEDFAKEVPATEVEPTLVTTEGGKEAELIEGEKVKEINTKKEIKKPVKFTLEFASPERNQEELSLIEKKLGSTCTANTEECPCCEDGVCRMPQLCTRIPSMAFFLLIAVIMALTLCSGFLILQYGGMVSLVTQQFCPKVDKSAEEQLFDEDSEDETPIKGAFPFDDGTLLDHSKADYFADEHDDESDSVYTEFRANAKLANSGVKDHAAEAIAAELKGKFSSNIIVGSSIDPFAPTDSLP